VQEQTIEELKIDNRGLEKIFTRGRGNAFVGFFVPIFFIAL
jgi:hypothetical protein